MNQYKIYVYAICKNEEQFVERWMDSVSEADGVIVTDTGSTDDTVKKLREKGAIVYEETISPWRFDKARTISLNHIPEDADICVCNDLDEIFEPGWRSKLESAWQPQYTRARYLFACEHHLDGTPSKFHSMEKIHRRHDFRWVHPVHEILEYSGTDPDRTIQIDNLILHHYPDLSKSRSQYLPLLELSVKENPKDDRAMFWLGREYMYYGKFRQCIETLQKHLALPSALWNEERSASMRFIAQSFDALNERQSAIQWLFRAIAECPHIREPYVALCKIGYLEENWPLVYAMAEKGLSITYKSDSYLSQLDSWGPSLYDYGAISAYRLGLYEESIEYAKKACELSPDDERLHANLRLIQSKLDESKKGAF